LRLEVNGEVRQAGRSSDMICDIAHLVASASAAFGLMPGDLLLTGSPPRLPRADGGPTRLQAGDRLTGHITGLGTMDMTVRDEDTDQQQRRQETP
jgi:2-keto-4-pentenoate hydratase/2-oxohepta-3-ene-1,7-dioic acid hydratase in catechol pathway